MGKVIRSFVFILAFFALPFCVEAQLPELIKNQSFRQDAQAAVDSLYNFNPAGADQKLANWKEKYPAHPLWMLMDGMEFWWQLLSDLHDHSRDEQFFNMMKEADYMASKLLYEQPGHADALIIRTVANGYIARQYSNREEWVSSLNAARKAYTSYGYLQDNVADLPDLQLAEGLKLYYSEYLPKAYPVVKTVSWFLPDGDKKEGLKKLEAAAEQAVFARAEASYFLGNINYNYENRYNVALSNFEQLYDRYPRNNYYVRLLVKNYYQTGQFDNAMQVVDEALARWQKNTIPFKNVLREELLFWKGRLLYRTNDLDEARKSFEQSLQLSRQLARSRHRSFYPATAYYLGSILQEKDQLAEAARYFELVQEAKGSSSYKTMAESRLQEIKRDS